MSDSLQFLGLHCWRRQWHPSPVLLPGNSHGRGSLVGCSPWVCWKIDTTEQLHFPFSLSCIGCSCLENPRDGGAWWAAIYGLAQSWTWLKQLSSSSSSIRVSEVIDIFLEILIPSCKSSNSGFHVMCSANKLNKQGDNKQPYCTPFSILNQSVVPYRVLTVASWSIHTFLRRGKMVWYFHHLGVFHSLLWSIQSKLYHSQWNRGRCFSVIPLLSLWSSKCWKFDLWLLCLF